MKANPRSLFRTIDQINEAAFYNRLIAAADRESIATWIAGRQGQPGAYAAMFAPTPTEMKEGARLFTGEAIKPSASLRHVAGEEACRALILLKPRSAAARSSLERASNGMLSRLIDRDPGPKGMFCCGTCDPALWRHFAVGGLRGAEHWIESGLKALKAHRNGTGRWRRFPFYYTLLALTELDLPEATREIEYVAPVCERLLGRTRPSSRILERRIELMKRALNRI